MNRFNVPVFLIYAGIIHAIGLALLLPLVVTLPGPGIDSSPETSIINVEVLPASPLAGKIEADNEQTSALPPPSQAEDSVAAEDAAEAADLERDGATAEPDAESGAEELAAEPALSKRPEEPSVEEKPKAEAVKSAKPAPLAKKPVAARSRAAKPASRRSVKSQTKFAPFDGALSGLFKPGAPVRRR
jgi:hypothetical protein